MTTIATFSKPEEAHLFRTRLEAVGIPAYVHDENIVQMDWLWSNAVGGVRVQIADDDLAEVREFFAADSPQPCPEASDVSCPSCGSLHTGPYELPRRLAYLGMLVPLPLLFIPMLFAHRRWQCDSCHHVFRVSPDANVDYC